MQFLFNVMFIVQISTVFIVIDGISITNYNNKYYRMPILVSSVFYWSCTLTLYILCVHGACVCTYILMYNVYISCTYVCMYVHLVCVCMYMHVH